MPPACLVRFTAAGYTGRSREPKMPDVEKRRGIVKTVLALLIVVYVGCGSYRSGQPATTSANNNDSLTVASSSPASSAAELNAPSSEPTQQQTQQSDLWD